MITTGYTGSSVYAPDKGLESIGLPTMRGLYIEWRGLKNAFRRGADAARLFARLVEIEECSSAYVPDTVEDMAYKILIADDGGDMDVNIHQKRLVTMARHIAGVVA